MKKIKYIKKIVLTLFLASTTQVSVAGFNTVFLLGDSLSDQGNLFSATEQILGEGIPASDYYYAGRFSNAENYVDYMSENIGIVITPSIMGGNNFAYGGTRTDYNRVEDDATKPPPVNLLGQGGILPEDAFPWTLDTQRQAFQSLGIVDPNALYIVFSGANDLADLTAIVAQSFSNPAFTVDPAEFIQKVVDGINNSIAAFVAAGGEDIIVANVPNLGVVPGITQFGPGFSALATGLSMQYNQALAAMLTQWEDQTNIIHFDTFSLLTQVVQEPEEFGFSNATEACYTGFVGPADPDDTVCSDPDSYVFWDSEHPTSAFHALMADFMLTTAAEDLLDDLILRVAMLDVHKGTKRSLTAKLDAAMSNLQKHNNVASVQGSLRAFINSINAQTNKKIAADDATILIERAERIMDLLVSG